MVIIEIACNSQLSKYGLEGPLSREKKKLREDPVSYYKKNRELFENFVKLHYKEDNFSICLS